MRGTLLVDSTNMHALDHAARCCSASGGAAATRRFFGLTLSSCACVCICAPVHYAVRDFLSLLFHFAMHAQSWSPFPFVSCCGLNHSRGRILMALCSRWGEHSWCASARNVSTVRAHAAVSQVRCFERVGASRGRLCCDSCNSKSH
jgi:hypothetical protein